MAVQSAIRQTDFTTERIQSSAFVIAVVVCAVLGVSFSAGAATFFGPSVVLEIDTAINPNDAPVASLVRLPGVGISKAAAIVTYREDISNARPGVKVFGSCDDLENVPGIGPKTVARLAEYLSFE